MLTSILHTAPETFTKRGYGPAVDWWSLAVLTYELLFGLRPFKAGFPVHRTTVRL